MYLPECFVWAMAEGCTGVNIYCTDDLRAKIAARFTEVFNEEYDKVLELVEEEDGWSTEKEDGFNPFNGAQIFDDGVHLSFGALSLYSGNGDFLASHDTGEALVKALKKIKKEFSSIRYEGYVAYSWSDVHSGDVCQYEISSENAKKGAEDIVYDFVGEALAEALQDDEVWDNLAKELQDASESDFKKILKLFHMYSQWIPTDAANRLFDISKNVDEDLKSTLERFIEDLNNGRDVEIKEDEIDDSGLPDGYMEALEMFMKAEEISEKIPKHGEVISSEGTFDIVIEQAEAGDAEAKFTVGKYFIAAHIEEETERAIRWILEAVDAGIEDAADYIKDHSELFE